jgi:anti-anti-sigma factor
MLIFNGTESAEPHDQPRCHNVVDCAGAWLFVHATEVATVLSVEGEVDESNAELLAQAIRRFTQFRAPLILDLRHLDFLGLAGFRVFVALNHEHEQALRHCSVIAGAALRRLTRIDTDHGLPIVDSVPEALQLIDTIIQTRRRFIEDLVPLPEPRRRRESRHRGFSVRVAGV